MVNLDLFKKEIDFINNEHIRCIVYITLSNSPDCIRTIPASSSGKYHPTYSLGDGGLARHIKATVGFAYALIEASVLEGMLKAENKDVEYGDWYEDIVYASLILHDCCKASDEDVKHRTLFDHPLIASELFIKNAKWYVQDEKENISPEDMAILKIAIPLIAKCISSHMGKYTTAPYARGIVLPKPDSTIEWFVHLCDLLSSRKYLDFNFEKYEEAVK